MPSERVSERWDDCNGAAERLEACARHKSVYWGGEFWTVFCFATIPASQEFKALMEGVNFDPKDHGKGRAWARWSRPEKEPAFRELDPIWDQPSRRQRSTL